MDTRRVVGKIKEYVFKYKKFFIGAGILVIVGYTIYAFRPSSYETLYENLSDSDRQAIIVELSKLGVDYKITETQAIQVKKQDVGWVRREMTNLGLPENSGEKASGYDLFLENSLGSTQKDLELKELTARKTQLEKELVRSFPFVEKAVVNFDMPKKTSIFDDEEKKGKASVNITFKKGETINAQQLSGIQYMVSSAIPGVNPEDVTIIDSEKGVVSNDMLNEGPLSSSYEKQLLIKSQVEKNIHDNVKNSLIKLFGYDGVQINVNVAINFDEIVQNIENYDDEGVLRSRSSERESTSKTEDVENPEAGMEANGDVLGYENQEQNGNVVYRQDKENTVENYEISKTVETVKKNPQLTNTNVTVWVDEEKLAEKNIDVEQLRRAVGNASGLTYNEETDSFENGQVVVFVSSMEKTNENENAVPESQPKKDGANIVPWLLSGVLLLLFAGAGVYAWFKVRKKKTEEEETEFADIEETDENEEEEEEEKLSDDETLMEKPEEENAEEMKHRRLVEEVIQLSNQYPKETADYIKKLLKERK